MTFTRKAKKMKKAVIIILIIGLLFSTMGFFALACKATMDKKALEKENRQLQAKVEALYHEVGDEVNGVVYASSSWKVYDTIENANMTKDSIGDLSDAKIIQKLILNNSIVSLDLRNGTKIGIRFASKSTFETYDGIHKQLVYSINPELFLVPVE